VRAARIGSDFTLAILVTGGAGYIGSHTCVELLERGEEVVVFDNLSNSRLEAVRRVEKITGKRIPVIVGDVRDPQALAEAFDAHPIEAVIHFAGLKAVGESTEQPLRDYENNVTGAVRLLMAMRKAGVRRLVFSSSATVYGDPVRLPLTEEHPLGATNPYGRTKLMAETMLRDLAQSEPDWCIAVLRYFNPVGAHESGLIGEDPLGTPNNLMPYLAQVAIGRRPLLRIFGGDYPTPDGTGVRDYVHVVDLAAGHVAALDRVREQPELLTANLGTGSGRTVLEMVRSFEAASGRRVAFQIVDRRPGDVASCYADASLAARVLGWRSTRGPHEMCADTWRWQSRNPGGYPE
jgi:UDP-glucose 4-epimerase